jgi:hypothetical protein
MFLVPDYNDQELLPTINILVILRDAAATHENAVGTDVDGKMHWAAAELIKRIIAGASSVRNQLPGWCGRDGRSPGASDPGGANHWKQEEAHSINGCPGRCEIAS